MSYDNNNDDDDDENVLIKNEKLSVEPTGLLAIHIKRAHKINIDEKDRLADWKYLMLRFIINENSKETKLALIEDNNECRFEDLRHFFIKISNIKEDIKNELKFELYAYGRLFYDNEYYFKLLAYRYINIVDLVRIMNVAEEFEMIDNKKRTIALIDLEFCFSYGCFGYGYSSQINIDSRLSQQNLAYSTFLRVKPTEYRKAEDLDMTEAVTVKPPEIIDFTEIDKKHTNLKKISFMYDVDRMEFPLIEKYFNKTQHYTYLKEKFNLCTSRVERLEYLQSLLTNREHYLSIFEGDLNEYDSIDKITEV